MNTEKKTSSPTARSTRLSHLFPLVHNGMIGPAWVWEDSDIHWDMAKEGSLGQKMLL